MSCRCSICRPRPWVVIYETRTTNRRRLLWCSASELVRLLTGHCPGGKFVEGAQRGELLYLGPSGATYATIQDQRGRYAPAQGDKTNG